MKKIKRNEIVVMLHNKGFSSRQIGIIMGISHVASAVIFKRDNTEELKQKHKSCVFCNGNKDLLFEEKINICNNCALRFKKIV